VNEPIPHPVLLNTWKHHAGWLRWRIATAVGDGVVGTDVLSVGLAVVCTRLMDLYTGPLAPAALAANVIGQLREAGKLEYGALADWLGSQGGYAMLDIPDGSRWAVRLGPTGGRYVHVHPGRRVSHTVRVQANTLKSAVMAVALGRVTGREPTDLAVVNEARSRYLGLLPVTDLAADSGLGAVIRLLAG
jgi:hypothetical protein